MEVFGSTAGVSREAENRTEFLCHVQEAMHGQDYA